MSILLKKSLKTLQWNLVFSEYLDPFPLYFVILANPVFCKVCYLICESIYTTHPGIFYFTVRTHRQGNPQRSQQLFPKSRDLRKLEGSSSVWERQRSGMANRFPGSRGRLFQIHGKQRDLVGVLLLWNWVLHLQIIFLCTRPALRRQRTALGVLVWVPLSSLFFPLSKELPVATCTCTISPKTWQYKILLKIIPLQFQFYSDKLGFY